MMKKGRGKLDQTASPVQGGTPTGSSCKVARSLKIEVLRLACISEKPWRRRPLLGGSSPYIGCENGCFLRS